MNVVIRESREEDIEALKNRLREDDLKEVIAAGNRDAEDSLRQSFTRSELRYTVDLDGSTVAMFGVVRCGTVLAPSGNVWFLGAPEMRRIKKTFVKMSRKFIAQFLEQYPLIWNVVDARYEASVRWLASCGAQFDPTLLTIGGVHFHLFRFFRRA